MDLGFPKYTWTSGNHMETFKGARLDRALCNMDWRVQFGIASVRLIPKLKSDHAPILTNL